jgi:hypothetical protein
MGIFDRSRPAGEPRGRTYEGQRVELSEDEQALARYRYMLKTAPPETIEQAHVEAFAKLTPQQRRMLLEQLLAEVPVADRAYAAENPQALARLATRAEVREPGIMERIFTRTPGAGAGPGFGGIMASSLLGSVAGTVLGTMIAQSFFGHHGMGLGDLAQGDGLAGLRHDAHTAPMVDSDSDFGGVDHTSSLDGLGPDLGGDFFDI